MRLLAALAASSALSLCLALLPGSAAGQPRPADEGLRHSRSTRSMKGVLGVPWAKRLIRSDDPKDRLRGVQRLGAIGTDESIGALIELIEQGSVIDRDPRARLEAVRILAGKVARDGARQILMREVTDLSSADGRGASSPLAIASRTAAALALAKSGEKKALASLLAALGQSGVPSETAARALSAYPPASLESFLEGRKRLTPQLATFFGNLGDLRAVGRLRGMLDDTDPAARVAGGIALAKLGDASAAPTAREWLKKTEARYRRAGAEMLVLLGMPDAPAAVVGLLEGEGTLDDGLRLALLAPDPSLAAPLAKALGKLPEASKPRAVAAIGRAGGAAELAALLEKGPDQAEATNVAFALATMPGEPARRALEQALGYEKGKTPEGRRLLARAFTVRALVLDDAPHGTKDLLRALLKEPSSADRAAGAFGLVAIGSVSLDSMLERACKVEKGSPHACDAAIVAASARGALALPDGASSLSPLWPLLVRSSALAGAASRGDAVTRPTSADEAMAIAASAALLTKPDGDDLPTPVLLGWADGGSPSASLAARALGSRDDDALRERLRALLQGSDPVVRAHAALGLARDPDASAVSILAGAYRFEEDAGVRRAVVRALSQRAEKQREPTLVLARDLDADDEVRALAREALLGRNLDLVLRPRAGAEPRRSVAWVSLTAAGEPLKPGEGAVGRPARVVRGDGLVLPMVADPDGVMLIPGLPAGPTALLADGSVR